MSLPGAHHTPYLSPSRLSTYDWCPAQYERRYVRRLAEPPTPERLFGTAVHAGLEAHFLGHANPLGVYLERWSEAQDEIAAYDAGLLPWGSGLRSRGLDLIDQVRALELEGVPEARMLMVQPGVALPFFGWIDLVTPGHVYDFKTTRLGWTQKKADEARWQPALYSAQYRVHKGFLPRFSFVVLPRVPGPIAILESTRDAGYIEETFELAQERLMAIDAGLFECTCGRHAEEPADDVPRGRIISDGMWQKWLDR